MLSVKQIWQTKQIALCPNSIYNIMQSLSLKRIMYQYVFCFIKGVGLLSIKTKFGVYRLSLFSIAANYKLTYVFMVKLQILEIGFYCNT